MRLHCIWLYNILANRIVLHIELVNTISPDILPSKESIGSIKQAQILFRAIILKRNIGALECIIWSIIWLQPYLAHLMLSSAVVQSTTINNVLPVTPGITMNYWIYVNVFPV